MYLFGTLFRTTSKSKSGPSTIASTNAMTALCTSPGHAFLSQTPHARAQYHTRRSRAAPSLISHAHAHAHAEHLFFQALARASVCRKHARHASTHHQHVSKRQSAPHHGLQQSQTACFSSHNGRREPAQAAVVERDELRGIIDIYESDVDLSGKLEAQHGIDKSPVEAEEQISRQKRTIRVVWRADDEITKLITTLNALLDNPLSPHGQVYAAYQALPFPRMPYLSDDAIGSLFHHLTVVEFREETSMLRYFSLMDDMMAAEMPIRRPHWNTAIAFSGRWARRVSAEHVENAMQIWLRMEREAGLRGDAITFSILFDVATKAGKFALAEVILKQMRERNLPIDRHLRTGIIYYHGVKGDGQGVRRTYKELVDAGEIVDTSVLNCVIASLMRAGEASTAEHVFERMKEMQAERPSPSRMIAAPRDWRARRELNKLLNRAGRQLRAQPAAARGPVQDASPVAPDLRTYRLLVRHHATAAGNIDRVHALLAEMRERGVPLHGSVFFLAFNGFALHGGVRYSSWTKARLDALWDTFLMLVAQHRVANEGVLPEDVADEDRGCYIDVGVVAAVLGAYAKCGGRDAVEEVWSQCLEHWSPSEREHEQMSALYVKLRPPETDVD